MNKWLNRSCSQIPVGEPCITYKNTRYSPATGECWINSASSSPLQIPDQRSGKKIENKGKKVDSFSHNLFWTEITQKLLSVVYTLPSFDPSKGVDYYNSKVPRGGWMNKPFNPSFHSVNEKKEGKHNKIGGKATNKVLVGKPVYKSTSSKFIILIPYFAITCPAKWQVPNELNSNSSVQSTDQQSWSGLQSSFFPFSGSFAGADELCSSLQISYSPACSPAELGKEQGKKRSGKDFENLHRENKNWMIIDNHPVRGQLIKQTELRLVRLQYPYLDSTILAQYVAMNASKYNFTRMQKTLFNKISLVGPQFSKLVNNKSNYDLSIVTNNIQSSLPSNMTGLKVELAGRLTTQRSIPRKTVSNYQKGSFNSSFSIRNNNAENSGLNFTQYRSKNKLGAFNIKVWLSDASS